MSSTATELLNHWDDDRYFDSTNKCSCKHCCKSSNICAACEDWSLSIEWKSIHPPHLKCGNSNCNNVYHMNCLPINKRLPNSWNHCSEIGSDYQCNINYLDFFTFFNKIENQEIAKKHNKLIIKKYHDLHPNKRIKIKSHFCGFQYNDFVYIVQDCCEILINGDDKKALCRIIDIILTQTNEAFILIQYYHFKGKYKQNNKTRNPSSKTTEKDETELYFENEIDINHIDLVKIGMINRRIRIVDNYQDSISQFEKLRQLKLRKSEEIKKLKSKHRHNFGKLCLKQNIECYKNITFDDIFWSNKSCNGTSRTYRTPIDDTNESRMKLQEEIIKSRKNKDKNNKRKLQYDGSSDGGSIKLTSAHNKKMQKHNNRSHRNIDNKHNDKKYLKNGDGNITTNNRKRKRFDESNSDDDNNNDNNDNNDSLLIPKLNVHKKRKIEHKSPNGYKNGTGHKQKEERIEISKKEYEEYLKWKIQINSNPLNGKKSIIEDKNDDKVARKLYDALKEENTKLKAAQVKQCKCKQYETEIINLQKSIRSTECIMKQYEVNEKKLKQENIDLNKKHQKLYKEGKKKRAKLRTEHDKIKENHKKEIKKLKDEMVKLKDTITSKDHQIEFLRKARDEQRARSSNVSYENNSNVIAYHISPADPRLKKNNDNDEAPGLQSSETPQPIQQQLVSQTMHPDEIVKVMT